MGLNRIVTAGIALLLASSPVLAQEQAPVVPRQAGESESQRRGRSDGAEAASRAKVQGTGWALGSVASNFILPVGGSVIVILVAANKNARLPSENATAIAAEDSVYRTAYVAGYESRLKARRRNAAVGGAVGGVLGLGVAYVIFVGGYKN